MTFQSNDRQVVLFDGDDQRTEVLDDIKQLSQIPARCEFYIYCNETDPIFDKILQHLSVIPQVRLRRSPDPVSQRMLEFLEKNIDKYSFFLIICGPNPTYEKLFRDIWKQYGNKKLFVLTTNNSSNITVKNILNQLRQNAGKGNVEEPISNDAQLFAGHPCPQCSQSFQSNKDLEEHSHKAHGSFLGAGLYMDSSANVLTHKKANQENKLIVQSEFYCDICNEDLQSQKALERHRTKEHSSDLIDVDRSNFN